MKKTNGYYMAKYLKSNFFVLLCELVIVLLLSLICTVILESQPVWLAPTIATVVYLMAELRFMMAYVATNARHEQELEWVKATSVAQAEDEQNSQQPSDEAADPDVPVVAEEASEQSEEPAAEEEAEQSEETQRPEESGVEQEDQESFDAEQDEQPIVQSELKEVTMDMDHSDDEDEAQDEGEAEPEIAPLAQADDLAEEQNQTQSVTDFSDDVQEDIDEGTEFDEKADLDEGDDLEMEAVILDDEVNVDDMTMDEGELATDTLEIGEIDEPSGYYKRRHHHS